MKRCLLACITLFIGLGAFAQDPDKALIRVLYTFNHIHDTMNRDKPRVENMLLIAGKNASVYTSNDKIAQTANRLKQIQEQMKNSAGGPMQIRVEQSSSRPITRIDNYFFAKENKFITVDNLFNNYLIEETAPQIDWKILKDTMSFSGILCQKATARFKGRNWVAWYAPDMPFQSGPWKLNGLPGLIIEAYDDKKEVQFLFAGTEKPEAVAEAAAATPGAHITGLSGATIALPGMDNITYSGLAIKLPADGIKTTQKEFDKLKEARDKDPQGFMKAQMVARGMNGANIVVRQAPPGAAGPGGTPRPVMVINNPVELPEK